MNAISASASPGRSLTSSRSPTICASKISCWLLLLMYSPAAMLKTPASPEARPAMSTGKRSAEAPATVLTTASVLTSPSWAPKIASRISPSRLALRRSSARCAASHARSNSCAARPARAASSSSGAVRSLSMG